MSDWIGYSLSDLLLFSPRVYFRLFELYNAAVWPGQIVALLAGALILGLLLRPSAAGGRAICVLLGAIWLWIAWAFFWHHYATINWASLYVAPVIALEGAVLILLAAIGRSPVFAFRPATPGLIALAIFAGALAGYPLIAPLMGRSWQTAEVFGIAPDPTAVATLAALVLARGGGRVLLMVIPLLWCVITGLTLWTLESGEYFVAPALAALAIAVSIAMGRGRAQSG